MITDFKKAIAEWKKSGEEWGKKGDKEMLKVHEDDVEDLNFVLTLTEEGDYKNAEKRMYNLDTIVRDQVPTELYEFLSTVAK
jgi:hypothetical protein